MNFIISQIKRFINWIPDFARWPLIAMLAINCATYFGTKLINEGRVHHDITTAFDQSIPFVAIFIFPYLVAFLQWGFGYVFIAKDNREKFMKICIAEIMAKIITFITFVVFPTMTTMRPDVVPTGFATWACSLTFSMDTPVNLLPSIHCLESWFILRGTFGMKSKSKFYVHGMCTLTIIIFLSTLFLKQHVILDMITAVALAEITLFIAGLIRKKVNAKEPA